MQVIWWTWKPWKWRPYLVRKSQWGPFGELHLGFVSILWRARCRVPGETANRGRTVTAHDNGAYVTLACARCDTLGEYELTETPTAPRCLICGYVGNREFSLRYPFGMLARPAESADDHTR